MKTIIAVISSLVVGALAANSSFSPLQEVQHWLANKSRFLYATALYAAGFVFVMTGIISGTIEATLQYEAQGFVFWSAMSTMATGFGVVGLLFIIAGRLTIPRFVPKPSSLSAAFGADMDWSEILSGAVKIFSELTTSAGQAPSAPAHASHSESSRPNSQSYAQSTEMHH